MTFGEFKSALRQSVPPTQVTTPLRALWWAAKGDWDRAHKLVQDESSADAAWVHAYLHRVEGDLANAGYWYRRAGKAVASGPLDEEWQAIATDLLQA